MNNVDYKLVTTTDGYLYFGKNEELGLFVVKIDSITLYDCSMIYEIEKTPIDIAVSGFVNGDVARSTKRSNRVLICNPSLIIDVSEKAVESINGLIEFKRCLRR